MYWGLPEERVLKDRRQQIRIKPGQVASTGWIKAFNNRIYV
jgi:hypothetical protein